MSKSAPMKILVYGAGAIGMAFGGFLSRHHEVTLLGRKKHAGAIRKNGIKVSGIWGNYRFKKVRYTTSWQDLKKEPFDLVLVTVKSFDTAANAKKIAAIAGSKTPVLSLQNGLGNIEALQRYLPKKQVLAGRVIFGVEVKEAGKIKITVIAHPTAIGETVSKRMSARVKKIAHEFNRSGLPSIATKDVESLLWSKVIYNAALNPLASLMHCHYGKLTEDKLTKSMMDEVIHEVYEVARRAKIKLKPVKPSLYARDFYGKLVPRTYHHHPSMLQDIQAGRRTEISAINGAVVRLARSHKMHVPVNEFLTTMIQKVEKNAL